MKSEVQQPTATHVWLSFWTSYIYRFYTPRLRTNAARFVPRTSL